MVMNNIHIERLIKHIADTLPIISDSVNEISNYVKKNEKLETELIKSLRKIVMSLAIKDIDGAGILESKDDTSILLYTKYIDGTSQIFEGVNKFLSIMYFQKDMKAPKGVQQFEGTEDEAQLFIKSAVDDLYKGSKEIVSVIDETGV